MVEQFHSQLKAALRTRLTSPIWTDELPHILLAIREPKAEPRVCSRGTYMWHDLAVPTWGVFRHSCQTYIRLSYWDNGAA